MNIELLSNLAPYMHLVLYQNQKVFIGFNLSEKKFCQKISSLPLRVLVYFTCSFEYRTVYGTKLYLKTIHILYSIISIQLTFMTM